MRRLVCVLMTLLFLASLVPYARADYRITLAKDGARVDISATLKQNVSIIQPIFSFKFLASNSSSLQDNFNNAAKSLTPSAAIQGLSMNISSDGSSIKIQLTYAVHGISFEETGPLNAGTFDLNLAWRALAVRNDFVINGLSVNLVGSAYYLLPLQQLTSRTIGGIGSATTFLNQENRPANVVQNATKNFALLDFSFLNTPLDNWQQSFDLASQASTFRNTAGFNVTVLTQFNEPGGSYRFEKAILWYVTNAEVIAPGTATPMPNGVKIDAGSLPILVMVAVILGSIGVFALSSLWEKRISSPRRFRKSKKPGTR